MQRKWEASHDMNPQSAWISPLLVKWKTRAAGLIAQEHISCLLHDVNWGCPRLTFNPNLDLRHGSFLQQEFVSVFIWIVIILCFWRLILWIWIVFSFFFSATKFFLFFLMEYGAFQNGENKDKMVSGTSVKITNVSQVRRHESEDCLATAVKKK